MWPSTAYAAKSIGRTRGPSGDPISKEVISNVVATPETAVGLALDESGGWLYWALREEIHRMRIEGLRAERILSFGAQSEIAAIALDLQAGRLYWADRAGGALGRSETDGANPKDFLSGLNEPWALLARMDGFTGRSGKTSGAPAPTGLKPEISWSDQGPRAKD